MMKIFVSLLIVFISLNAWAQLNLEIEGSLNFDNSVFTVKEAGLDFTTDFTENESTIYLSITDLDELNKKNNPNNKWSVYIFLNETPESEFQIQVKRTGNGYKPSANGTPNIHNGLTDTDVLNTPSSFFKGKGDIVYIPVNIRIKGGSVSLGAGEFESRISFKVVDDW